MKVASMMLVVAALAAGLVVPAEAVTNYLSVDWYGPVQRVDFTIAGTGIQDAYIAQAHGYLDNVLDGQHTPGYTDLGNVFCVDVFDFAYSGAAYEWGVDVHTQADGNAGWTTPPGDNDALRDPSGLARAAYLANKYGRGVMTSDRQIALNVAIWRAAYGSNFSLTGNGNLSAPQKAMYDAYAADYALGKTAQDYEWFDSSPHDQGSRYQDFLKPVPEPGTLFLLGSGLFGLGLALRRRA